ncbi:MAG TPA: regulatory protein RecX [Cyclobacteriaceae bacterium]|jgi:regulatory protein|nr:regulatory protein RecX [Cyclobacteriaceae bacterium]
MKKFKQPATKINHQGSNNQEALNKIFRYCAYQERSHREVKTKLFEYGLPSTKVDEIISYLITEGFLNEERYAKAFAGGKFRIMKWGRLKIQRELESSGVSARNIARGLAEITSSEYSKTLLGLIKKKSNQVEDDSLFKKKNKVARFVMGKGYEPELVWEAVNDLMS